MKKKIILLIVSILFLLIITALFFLQTQRQKNETILNLTPEQKLADFEALCTILKENYPFWKEAENAGIDKDALYATYRTNIQNAKTDIQFFKEINYFLKEFRGLGHLSVLDGYMYLLYSDTLTAGEEVLTAKEAQAVEPLIAVLTNPISESTYSLLDQSHEGFRSTVGLKEEYQNTPLTNDIEESTNLTTSILDNFDNEKTAYLKIASFALANYQQDQAIIEHFFAEIEGIPNLIIDLRGNGGGSDLYWEDLLVAPNVKESLLSERYYLLNVNEITEEYIDANVISTESIPSAQDNFLSQYTDDFSHYTKDTTIFAPAEHPYTGNIYILIDEDVYSSAENFVIFCKNTGFATLVGTATGGDGGIADPMLFSLPNSGLIVRFSIFYGLNADGSGNEANGTVPDIAIAEDENALDKCLSIILLKNKISHARKQ
uniref:S41 family peptidase n=1 Tax=Acetatifactor sp. TaxID=1872090 RepID=UPI004057C97E